MNNIDFNSSPDGFPLEADSTLGYMFDSLRDAILGLAKLADDDVIVSGVIDSGGSVTDGWIVKDGEFLFFQGGTKSANCIIEETVISKNNQNGTPVDRYFTRKVIFGTGAGQFAFNSLRRVRSVFDLMSDLHRIAVLGEYDSAGWVVIEGLEFNPGTNTVSAGTAYFGGEYFSLPAQAGVSSGTPYYITPDGEWSAADGTNYLEFAPYASRRIDAIVRRNMHPVGSLMFIADSDFTANMASQFDGTGLGSGDWLGWAIANGNNGTVSTANFTNCETIQRI